VSAAVHGVRFVLIAKAAELTGYSRKAIERGQWRWCRAGTKPLRRDVFLQTLMRDERTSERLEPVTGESRPESAV
jgi:hypothetical protein